MATNGNFGHQDQYKAAADQYAEPSPSADSGASAGNSNLSKDEVGWYFVEQYYTTLSKNPEKLHLFYSKRSQFVYGLEAEVANVSVGRPAIQERIKQLDFQDCKVRISNVDSQASFDSIVIQVIGETSNKGAEPKKFVQTFVLAKQPSGYFVLNDILRYVNEEDNGVAVEAAQDEAAPAEAEAAEAPAAEAEAAETAEESSIPQFDAAVIDKKLEAVSTEAPAAEVEAVEVAETKADAESADPDQAAQEIAEEEAKKPEVPKDPSPTPVAHRAAAPAASAASAAVAAEAERPREPLKPMTWASRAAAAAGPPRPVVPLPKTATPPASAQPRPAAPAPAAAPAAEDTPAPEAAKESGEWQTAGTDAKRQGRPQSISGPPAEKEGTMGYVKYVTEKVKTEELRLILAAYGELTYFDINRAKNCAFVEFATPTGYQAAVAANPHIVNGENIVVEPRRPKANAYGGNNYNPNRGSISGRGRGGFDGNRPGSQGGGRGGFTGQSRGRGGAPRGRGASQAANA